VRERLFGDECIENRKKKLKNRKKRKEEREKNIDLVPLVILCKRPAYLRLCVSAFFAFYATL
jgi:hypothetical protein